jgi:hypothetical protein
LFAGGTQMRMKIRALAAVVGLTLALGASPSRAAIVETVIDTDFDTMLGSITFPTLIGDSAAGVLVSYGGFTQADITSISWSLDLTTAAVVTLDLNALKGDNPCPNGGDCSNTTLNLTPILATAGGTSCSFSGDTGSCEASERVADISFVVAPEPSTWAMMVVGFVGLGLAGRRSSKAAAG